MDEIPKPNGNGVTSVKVEFQGKEIERLYDRVGDLESEMVIRRTNEAAMRERMTLMIVGLSILGVIGNAIAIGIAAYLRP